MDNKIGHRKLRIGTRGSKLALRQAHSIGDLLKESFSGLEIEYVIIRTRGDRILDTPLSEVGGKGLFIKEIEQALLDGRVDLAVHSMKDMPARLTEGLQIAAVPRREDPRDALVSRDALTLAQLQPGSKVGTGSLRRRSQLLHFRPDLSVLPIRGNLDTRIAKMASGAYDAIVVAAAGIRRMGLDSAVSQILPLEIMLPAVGQGALCVESCGDGGWVHEMARAINHRETRLCVEAERAFLQCLEGDCHVPIAAYGHIHGKMMDLRCMVADADGMRVLSHAIQGDPEEAEALGAKLGREILALGARRIIGGRSGAGKG